MAAISIPHQDPWVVARWAYRTLLERAETELELAEDISLIQQALALDGLSFGLLEETQRKRVGRVLARVADEVRADLLETPSDDPRDAEFAEYLSVLEMRLHDVFE